jgi:hypothetical protein
VKVIGNVDSPAHAAVDGAGTVTPWRANWSVGWWVRGADRWHVPAEERTLTQSLIDPAPVVETSIRVPDGRAVHRAWCAVVGTDEWIAVEVENDSGQPIVVAFTLATVRRMSLDGTVVRAGRDVAAVLPRPPSRILGATPDDGGGTTWTAATDGRAAFVFPVAHTARVRVAVPLMPTRSSIEPAALPPVERVVRGWATHVEAPGSMRVVGVDEQVGAEVARLLVVHDDPDDDLGDRGAALATLSSFGHHDTVRRALGYAAEDMAAARWRGAGAVLHALALHHRFTDEPVSDDTVAVVAEAAHRLGRRHRDDPWTPAGQHAAAALLEQAGQADAAARIRRQVASTAPAPLTPLDDLRAALVHDGAIGPGWRDEWLGRDVEVHDAPTSAGPLSYAVRWHGARPALLWHHDRRRPVTLTAPKLDPAWSTTEARGEALLAPVEPAGGLPGVVAPLPGGTPASSAPEAGTWE